MRLVLFFLIFIFMSPAKTAYDPFEPDIIQLTNTATADVNTNPQTEFNNFNTTPVTNTDTDADVFISITSNGVFCAPGTYIVDVALYHTGTATRSNPAIEVTVNSVSTGIRGANGYIRNSNGHNESTTTVVDLVQISTPSKIGFDTLELGAVGGTVPAPVGQSSFRIVRIDDR